MEQQSSINSFDTSIFLNRGAFVRWEGAWQLFILSESPTSSHKSQGLSIGYRNFFDLLSSYIEVAGSAIWNLSEWKQAWKAETPSGSIAWQGPRKELYTKGFEQIQEKFRTHEWKKAVPIGTDRAQGPLRLNQLTSILAQLSDVPDNLIPFGFWTPEGGVVGASPEIIFYRDGSEVRSMALAGTQAKPGPCTLLQDKKNRNEHQIVVDELNRKWNCWGRVLINPTEILELPSLYHLLTRVQVQLNENPTNEELVNFFHPTSALGTSPYEKWQELKALPEQASRGYFGAPFVFPLGEQKSVAIVALRQVQWNQSEIQLSAGGGVVQESQEELEWQEILAKMGSVKKLLKV